MCFLKSWFFDLQKNRSQKLSMLEEKQGQFWNLHQIPHKTSNPDFRFSLYFFDDGTFANKITITFFSPVKKSEIKKIENRDLKFC